MLSVYISGQISNLSEEEYTDHFNTAENILRSLNYNPVNPLKVQACVEEKCNTTGTLKDDGAYLHAYHCYMKHDILAMLQCHVIALLPTWKNSRGAKLELDVAKSCGLHVFYFDKITREGLLT